MRRNFVIAKYWEGEDSNRLCVYSQGSEVHYGTEEEAKSLADWVSEETGEPFQAFFIDEPRAPSGD